MDDKISACQNFAVVPGQEIDLRHQGPIVLIALIDEEPPRTRAFIALDPDDAKLMAQKIIEAAHRAEVGEGRVLPRNYARVTGTA